MKNSMEFAHSLSFSTEGSSGGGDPYGQDHLLLTWQVGEFLRNAHSFFLDQQIFPNLSWWLMLSAHSSKKP